MLRLDAERSVSFCDGLTRRDFLHAGGFVGQFPNRRELIDQPDPVVHWRVDCVEIGSASERESKHAMLRRLLRRVAEPLIVFTDYRDTLHHLATVLDYLGGR